MVIKHNFSKKKPKKTFVVLFSTIFVLRQRVGFVLFSLKDG